MFKSFFSKSIDKEPLVATENVLVCPFCGAPHGEVIPVGVVQVKCHYCGAMVVVPPQLGGVVQRCPNHPEVLAVGLCNDCGRSFCDRCLYLFEVEHGKLYLCSKCFESRSGTKNTAAILMLVLSAVCFILFFAVVMTPVSSGGGPAFEVLFGAVALLVASIVGLTVKKKPQSVHDFLAQTAQVSHAFLKKCVKCGGEIPIASEQCQHCGADQPEHAV